MANISELNAGQGNVNVEGTIKEKAETRSMNKFGKELRVANAILEDSSGTIKLTLWNDDTARFKEGDRIKIQNGYVGEFQGEKQLTSGKFGSIEKISSEDKSSESAAENSTDAKPKVKKEKAEKKIDDFKEEELEESSDEMANIEEEVY